MSRPTKQSKINQKISESMRENQKSKVSQLRDAASKGERPVKQYKFAEISKPTYYRWLEENPQLRDELAQLLTNFRKTKIKEATLIGAPVAEQRQHANKMTEKEYNNIMQADPEFAEEVEIARECNLKLWARRNIAMSIQEKGNVADSWRYLEHMEKEMNKIKLEIDNINKADIEDEALLEECEEKLRNNIHDRIKKNSKINF